MKMIPVYTFQELSDKAKERAINHFREGRDFPWHGDYEKSLQHFAKCLNLEIKDYNIGYPGTYITADYRGLRGLTLKAAKTLKLSDGFCAGEGLQENFVSEFEKKGDAKAAAEYALREFTREWEEDIDYYFSEECIREQLSDYDDYYLEDGTFVGY